MHKNRRIYLLPAFFRRFFIASHYKRLAFISLSAFLLGSLFYGSGSLSTRASEPFPSGLVAYWPGDGNADDVVGGHNGTLLNGATFAPGISGQAFSLDGVDDYIRMGDSTGLPLGSSPRSISLWMKVDALPTTPQIIFEYGELSGEHLFAVAVNSIMNKFYVTQGTTEVDGHNLMADTWTHVVTTYDGSLYQVYANGALVGTGSMSTDTLPGGLTIGEVANGGTYSFKGLIDEVQVYDRALTPQEVVDLLAWGIASTPTPTAVPPPPANFPSGIIGYWPGNGNVDDVVGGHTGILVNGTTFASGKLGQAFSLDGIDDYIVVNYPAGFPLGAAPRTVSLWIKVEAAPTRPQILFFYGQSKAENLFAVGINTTGNQFYVTQGTTEVDSQNPVTPNTWTYVVASFDGSLYRIYENGVLAGSGSMPTNTQAGSMTLSEIATGGTYPFKGLIDDVQVYNRALSVQEITALYTMGNSILSTPTPTPTVLPPTITMNDVTLEGNTTGGRVLAFADIGNAHTADGSVPSISCVPALGSVLPLGSALVSCTVTDNGGLQNSDSGTITVLDRTAPTITCPANINGIVDQEVALGSPTISDIVDPSPIVTNNAPSTFAPGTTAVLWTATDASSNEAACSQNVTLHYNFSGFFQPVDMPPVFNRVNGTGRNISVKFSLASNQGLSIFATGYPTSRVISCNSGAPVDDIEETTAAGPSGLQYDPLSNQYIYSWSTSKSWSGTCRQLNVKLNDGTEHKANFQFK